MSVLRVIRCLAAVTLGAAAALVFLAGPASAQCGGNGQAYPPGSPCGVSLSATQVQAGGTISGTASGFAPGAAVTATITPGGLTLTLTADANGVVSFSFSTAGFAPGTYTITFVGAGGVLITQTFTVTGKSSGGSNSGSGKGNGGQLASTGLDNVIPLSIAGAGLVLVGGTVLVLSRRRRSSTGTPAL